MNRNRVPHRRKPDVQQTYGLRCIKCLTVFVPITPAAMTCIRCAIEARKVRR
jgi:hypothetical protein